jgi:competence protein ComEC
VNNYPLIKFAISFIAGIILQSIIQFSLSTLVILFSIFLLILITIHFTVSKDIHIIKIVFVICTAVLFGSLYYSVFTQNQPAYPFEDEKYSTTSITGTVEKIDLKREGRLNIYISSDSIYAKNKFYNEKFNLLCSIYDGNKNIDSLYNILKVGNKISIIGSLQRPRDERNPGEFDYSKYLLNKGIVGISAVYGTDKVLIKTSEVIIYKNLIFEIRKKIDEKIASLHNKTTSALLRGLLLADRSMIDNQINDYFINAGVVHVLSVSGLHVGYIVLIFLVIFNRFNVYTRYLLTFAGLLFYLIITGADSPVFRSTIMAIALMSAPVTGRDYNSLNSLSLAAILLLFINPLELFNPGFQLSFSAILSLIIIYPPLKRFIDSLHIRPKALNWFIIFCMTSITAQLGTLPFTLTYFHRLSISALIANLIVIPVSGAIVALGILTIAVGTLSGWMGALLGSANELTTYLMYYCVQFLGNKKFAFISFNQFSYVDAIIFYSALIAVFLILKKFLSPLAKLTGVSLTIILMVLLMQIDNYDLMPQNLLSVMAVDVGQGDATLIKFPGGKTALVDAGNATPYFDNGERVILPLLNRLNIDKIDYAFISHADADHYKGFISLIKEGLINLVYKPKLDTALEKDIELENFLRKMKVPFKYYSPEIISIDNARIYVLNDTANSYFSHQNSNDQSGMIKLVYNNCSFLFTGDAGTGIEKYYLNTYGRFLKSDVLKAGHHGSKNSSSAEFLEAVNPGYVLISAGIGNRFRHPNKIIVDRMTSMNINILRTDKQCGLLIRSDGYKVTPINWKEKETAFNF